VAASALRVPIATRQSGRVASLLCGITPNRNVATASRRKV